MMPEEKMTEKTDAKEMTMFMPLSDEASLDGNHIASRLEAVMESTNSAIASLKDQHFTIASCVKLQSDQLREIALLINHIKCGNRDVSLQELSDNFSVMFDDFIKKVLLVSKLSMDMLYKMDVAMRHIADLEPFITNILAINKQANLLALNATIESARFGKAGEGFAVVADEVRDVTKSISELTTQMRGKIIDVNVFVSQGYDLLKQVAALDMSELFVSKDEVRQMLDGLQAQSKKLSKTLNSSSEATSEIHEILSRLTSDIIPEDGNNTIKEAVRILTNEKGTL